MNKQFMKETLIIMATAMDDIRKLAKKYGIEDVEINAKEKEWHYINRAKNY